MFRCNLCNERFNHIHHQDRCRDNLINEIVDDLDDIRNLSILKKILDYIKQFTDTVNQLSDFMNY
jgi:hypothetical protein